MMSDRSREVLKADFGFAHRFLKRAKCLIPKGIEQKNGDVSIETEDRPHWGRW
jgi:hypothetical protein